MTSAAIRQELHHFIDIADDVKVKAMYKMLQGGDTSNEKYTAAELAEFYDRLEKYESGVDSGLSMEETFAYLGANRKK